MHIFVIVIHNYRTVKSSFVAGTTEENKIKNIKQWNKKVAMANFTDLQKLCHTIGTNN